MFFSALLFLPASAFAQEAILTSINGKVEIRASKSAEWQTAVQGNQLSEEGGLRTGEDGRAILLFKNGAKIWVKEKTTLNISEQKFKSNQISLLSGSIKVRVPHLQFREKFQLRTPTSLASVRGTILTFEATPDGQPSLNVLFGEVKLVRTDPDSEQDRKSVV